ncbi:putative spermidine/putrescine transport system substrate-binding protein [Stella humosa]|uniref:Putative spermidine/putrescine transport system substrate-binding protein n=1 Tax=Stella humosa TaxID=94 RepID=A0A3N1MLM4_9PROT|nr:ABC transporter substrate-binding protein [Stella humosa]ROQ01896.1 putative spermidine/putrescine transport system substrate-binding protein [Stella humosa]BBK32285.1 polyamine ABC transporter substrate-binding protein [Stella humosa]
MTRPLTLVSALLGAAALAGSAQAQQPSSITVAWYGGNWGDAFRACVAEPFTKATGIAVNAEIGTSTVTLAKLQQQKANPTIDVAWMDGGISELALAADVTDNLDAGAIRNLANTLPEAVYKSGATTYAVGTGYYSLGIAYNTQKVKTAPTSWNDLWKKEFEEAVTIPSPSNSSGVPLIIFLSKIWGVPTSDLSATFKKIKELKPALFFDSSGAATNAYQSGEAIIGAHFNVGAWDLTDKGLPIAFVVPKEGAWATDARLHLVKGTARKDAAQKFIDQALTPEAAACLADKLYLGPSVKGVTIKQETARKLPWGETGSVKNLQLFDWAEINALRPKIVDTWNREIARK